MMQTITAPTTFAPQPEGIIVHTALKAGRVAGRVAANHSEGVVVRSDIKAGGITTTNHSEGVVVRSDVKAGGIVVPQ